MAVSNVSTINADTWQLISTTTITSGTTSYNFNSLSGYKTILIAGKNIVKSGAVYSTITINGDTSAGAYAYNAQSGSDTQFYVTGNSAGPAALAVVINDIDQAVPHRIDAGYTTYPTALNNYYTNPVVITSIQLNAISSGSFTSGTIYLYGIAS